MRNNTNKLSLCLGDLLYCFKLSFKFTLIPIILGTIISLLSQLINGNGIRIYDILLYIRNAGFITACGGMLIGAIGYLMPMTHLRPLDYNDDWQKYFSKFNLVTVITIICIFIIVYTLILDVTMYMIYT